MDGRAAGGDELLPWWLPTGVAQKMAARGLSSLQCAKKSLPGRMQHPCTSVLRRCHATSDEVWAWRMPAGVAAKNGGKRFDFSAMWQTDNSESNAAIWMPVRYLLAIL